MKISYYAPASFQTMKTGASPIAKQETTSFKQLLGEQYNPTDELSTQEWTYSLQEIENMKKEYSYDRPPFPPESSSPEEKQAFQLLDRIDQMRLIFLARVMEIESHGAPIFSGSSGKYTSNFAHLTAEQLIEKMDERIERNRKLGHLSIDRYQKYKQIFNQFRDSVQQIQLASFQKSLVSKEELSPIPTIIK